MYDSAIYAETLSDSPSDILFAMYSHILSGMYCDILGIYSGILSSTLSFMYSHIPTDILSAKYSYVLSGILSDKFCDALSDIFSDALSDILSGMYSGILPLSVSR